MDYQFQTVVLSDIHIGSHYSKVVQATDYLSGVSCKRLILNGDIVDGWQMIKKERDWIESYTLFFAEVIRKMEHESVEVVYLMGNHDDFLRHVAPIIFSKFSIVRSYAFSDLKGRSVYITHGDILDNTSVHRRWLAQLGDTWYHYMLSMNGMYNWYRDLRKKPRRSFARVVKTWAKGFFSNGSEFTQKVVELAHREEADIVICGHTHVAQNSYVQDVLYLNSGDWMESRTALVETNDGEWRLYYYDTGRYVETEFVSKIGD